MLFVKPLKNRVVRLVAITSSVLAIGFVCLNWAYPAQQLSLSVTAQKVDLAALGDDWNRFCVLGPYSNNATAEMVTGVALDIERLSSISSNDSIVLLVLFDAQGRSRLVEVSRSPSDFTSLAGTCWNKGTDFKVSGTGHPFVQQPPER